MTGRILAALVTVLVVALGGCTVESRVGGASLSPPDMGEVRIVDCTNAGCPAGMLCVLGECCAEAQACSGVCCADGQVCALQQCVTPGNGCMNSSQCPPDQYCAVTNSLQANELCKMAEKHCLPKPPECPPGMSAPNCVEQCEQVVAATFDPVMKYSWPANVETPVTHHPYDVMMTPLVIQLTDTDCDGQITSQDRSSIVVSTFQDAGWNGSGTLHVLAVNNGTLTESWTYAGVYPVGALAGGNLDGINGNEIVACAGSGATVVALRGTGLPLWGPVNAKCINPAIADLDGDGKPEVIVEGGILAGATGQLLHTFTPTPEGFLTVGDITGDKRPEIVFSNAAYDANGALLVDVSAQIPGSAYSWATLVDLDRDGNPEVIGSHYSSDKIAIWHYDAAQPGSFTVIRAPFQADVNPGTAWGWSYGMGSITAGDFNGDGTPDAGYVGFRGFVVLDGNKLMDPTVLSNLDDLKLWSLSTDEDNGSTGSAVFDFDGDGRVEVLYNDTQRVHIYRGATGEDVTTPICNTTGSQFEYPVIADVDGDGEADIVLVANAFANRPGQTPSYDCDGTYQSGVRVFGSASHSWVQTRPIWNQHTYHVTNVGDDGTIPASEVSNWTVTGLNNFRQNKQVGNEFGIADAVVSVLPSCESPFGIRTVITNLGNAPIPPGVQVAVYRDDPTPKLLGTVSTSYSLFPLQTQTLFLAVGPPDDKDLQTGDVKAFAIVDEAKTLKECHADNNKSPSTNVACGIP